MARRRRWPSQGGKTFLLNHTDGIASIDLFLVPTISFRLLYGLLILQRGRRKLLWVVSRRIRPRNGFGERRLHHLLKAYQEFYNEARTHLSLERDAPIPHAVHAIGQTMTVPILGGSTTNMFERRFPTGTGVVCDGILLAGLARCRKNSGITHKGNSYPKEHPAATLAIVRHVSVTSANRRPRRRVSRKVGNMLT
jgi:hypothetical protein